MKITIITVSFNSVSTIENTIRSVLGQFFTDIEYIIIDGGSTDGTLDVIRTIELSQRGCIRLYSEPDQGIYDAMNKGIQLSTGEVIGILNSDDIYDNPCVLSDVMSEFKKFQNVDLIYGNLVYVETENVENVVRHWVSCTYYDNFFEDGEVPPHPSLFVRRKVYESAGLFNLRYKLAADYEFMLRVFKKYEYSSRYIDKVFVRMRLGGATNKSFLNILKQNLEILEAWKFNDLKIPLRLMPTRFFKRMKQFIKL